MEYPLITILHRLPNRIRLKLSTPLLKVDEVIDNLLKENGIVEITYTPITRTLLIYFKPQKISVKDVIFLVIIVYALECSSSIVQVHEYKEVQELSPLVFFSAVSIITASAARMKWMMNPQPMTIQYLDIAAAILTGGAIIDHAWLELSRMGILEPEAVSIMYLLNSVFRKHYLSAAIFTWITTFSRHVFSLTKKSIDFKVFKLTDKETGELFYNLMEDNTSTISGIHDFIIHMYNKIISSGGSYQSNLFKRNRENDNSMGLLSKRFLLDKK